ncbi:hypothetical protein M9H77_15774 [Catharanthus roseus]|uniref:Uncharacterized protein n=1 Tax=Catharanthus roseus TaxID=4058 RepID=A0ACC0AYT4_CATRO|nr:hypothetical protein M9H77_15774 [Catharanthus roseus]
MASKGSKSLVLCALIIIVMILSNEIYEPVEARHLKPTKKGSSKKSSLKPKVNINGGHESTVLQGSKVEHAEDFRPTAPGRSPGVGHSIHD